MRPRYPRPWYPRPTPLTPGAVVALAFVYAAAPLGMVAYHVVGPLVTPLVRWACRFKGGDRG